MGRLLTTAMACLALLAASPGAAATSAHAALSSAPPGGSSAQVFATGAHVTHPARSGQEVLSKPDDITSMGTDIFVGFQNGVGPQGQASPTGTLDSTVVEFSAAGAVVGKWDIAGKCDGLTADPATGKLIATVNEDAHSSVYLIDPAKGILSHYQYNEPLPSQGGTDAISVYHGMVLISASAPGTTGKAAPQSTYPAVYEVTFAAASHVATVRPLFFDEDKATFVATGATPPTVGPLALTDPDSNEDVPSYATRFAGDFMLTSQGDKEQIFVGHAGGPGQTLSVLKLSGSVDDTAWASGPSGAIYTTDNKNDTIYKITGPFRRGEVFVAATPCDASNAPSTCPAPGFPTNYLGHLNPNTGVIARVNLAGPAVTPQGMLFLP